MEGEIARGFGRERGAEEMGKKERKKVNRERREKKKGKERKNRKNKEEKRKGKEEKARPPSLVQCSKAPRLPGRRAERIPEPASPAAAEPAPAHPRYWGSQEESFTRDKSSPPQSETWAMEPHAQGRSAPPACVPLSVRVSLRVCLRVQAPACLRGNRAGAEDSWR